MFDEDVSQNRNDTPAGDVIESTEKVNYHHQTNPSFKRDRSKQNQVEHCGNKWENQIGN